MSSHASFEEDEEEINIPGPANGEPMSLAD